MAKKSKWGDVKIQKRPSNYYDQLIPGYKKSVSVKNRKLTTAVSFTADELSALADYIAAGMVMLRISTPHRSVSKFKAAMSRLKIPASRGL